MHHSACADAASGPQLCISNKQSAMSNKQCHVPHAHVPTAMPAAVWTHHLPSETRGSGGPGPAQSEPLVTHFEMRHRSTSPIFHPDPMSRTRHEHSPGQSERLSTRNLTPASQVTVRHPSPHDVPSGTESEPREDGGDKPQRKCPAHVKK